MKINIQWQDQHNEADAYRTAQRGAERTKKRHRLANESGSALDLVDP